MIEALIYGVKPIATIDALSSTPPDTAVKTSPILVPSKSFFIASAGIPATGIDERTLKITSISKEKRILSLISFVLKICLILSNIFCIL
jgi:hypothetical protein